MPSHIVQHISLHNTVSTRIYFQEKHLANLSFRCFNKLLRVTDLRQHYPFLFINVTRTFSGYRSLVTLWSFCYIAFAVHYQTLTARPEIGLLHCLTLWGNLRPSQVGSSGHLLPEAASSSHSSHRRNNHHPECRT